MFDHRSLATDGLHPDVFTPMGAALLGTFLVEVSVTPVPYFGGGGGFAIPRKDKYRVRIRVTRNGKEWNLDQIVGDASARVIARLFKVNTVTKEDPVVGVTGVRVVHNHPPKIKVKKK